MSRQVFEFRDPERFVAGTVGMPGERTFFLQARNQVRSAFSPSIQLFTKLACLLVAMVSFAALSEVISYTLGLETAKLKK